MDDNYIQRYLKTLSKQYRNTEEVAEEIINLQAIYMENMDLFHIF